MKGRGSERRFGAAAWGNRIPHPTSSDQLGTVSELQDELDCWRMDRSTPRCLCVCVCDQSFRWLADLEGRSFVHTSSKCVNGSLFLHTLLMNEYSTPT